MTTHSGRDDEAREGVILPPADSDPWPPTPASAAPSAGQPWGQPWGPGQPGATGEPPRPAMSAPPVPPVPPATPGGGEDTAAIPAVEVTAQIRALPAHTTPERPATAPPPAAGGPEHAPTQLSPVVPAGPPGPALPRHATPERPSTPPAPPAPARLDQAATQLSPQVRPPAGDNEAPTQLIPPVPAGGGADAAPTQVIPPVPATGGDEAATQLIPPVPANAGEAPTQLIPPVPGNAASEAATTLMPPVPAATTDQATARLGRPVVDDATTQLRAVRPGPRGPAGHAAPPPPQHPQPQGQFSALFDHAASAGPPQGPPPAGGYPYPPEPAPRAGGDRRKPFGIALAVIAGCAVLGLLGGALLGGGDESREPTVEQTTETEEGGNQSAEGDPSTDASTDAEAGAEPGAEADAEARAQAEALSALLADSSASRDSVIQAVADIGGCTNLDAAANNLRAAAAQRNGLVDRLNTLSLDALPEGTALAAALTEAWQASAEADDHYAYWADEARTDPAVCRGGGAGRTDRTNLGDAASGRATTAKERAAQLWNPIATQYGLPERTSNQL